MLLDDKGWMSVYNGDVVPLEEFVNVHVARLTSVPDKTTSVAILECGMKLRPNKEVFPDNKQPSGMPVLVGDHPMMRDARMEVLSDHVVRRTSVA